MKVLEDDGTLMIGRVMGFEGDFIEGKGRIEASAGRIRVSDISPGLDGSVLLRYHSVPYLTTSPPVALEPERREDDPVPFIRLRPPAGTSGVELELRCPVGSLATGISADHRRRFKRRHASGLRERGFLQGRGMPCQRSTPEQTSPVESIGYRTGSSGASGH